MSSVLGFFILICVLVFVHEYGHFWAARRCGVGVIRFSIGFGKVLWRKKDKHGTEFALSMIPLGGYVQMFGGEAEHNYSKAQSLHEKSVWQRAFIVIAGPMANFLFAIVAYFVVFSLGVNTIKPVIGDTIPNSIAAKAQLPAEFEFQQVNGSVVRDWEETFLALMANVGNENVEVVGTRMGEFSSETYRLDLSQWKIEGNKENPLTTLGVRMKGSQVEPIIRAVVENSPAEKADVRAGDRIMFVNQQPFDWSVLVEQVQTGKPVEIVIHRDSVSRTVELMPEQRDGRYVVGISPTYQPLGEQYRTEIHYDPLTAVIKSIAKVGDLIQTIWKFIVNLITGELSVSNMGSPIAIAKGAGETMNIGILYYLSFMALISVNLGVMNLFPILPLDGGQLLLLTGEAIRKKPVSAVFQQWFQTIGVACVFGLMVFTLLNDLIHF